MMNYGEISFSVIHNSNFIIHNKQAKWYHNPRPMIRPRFICRAQPGFLLLEALLGIAVFALFVSAIGFTLLYGQENTIMAGDRTRAAYYSEQALDAVRTIRDGSFSALTNGQHGVYVNAAGVWAFTGSQIVHSGGYITHVYVTQLDTDWKRVSARTRWKHGSLFAS